MTLVLFPAESGMMRAVLPSNLAEEIMTIGRAYNMYEHEKRGAKHAEDMTPELIDAMVIAGPPSKCIEQIQALRDIGVENISMVLYSLSDTRGAMRRFAEEVYPKVR